jgi:hypothetical protein
MPLDEFDHVYNARSSDRAQSGPASTYIRRMQRTIPGRPDSHFDLQALVVVLLLQLLLRPKRPRTYVRSSMTKGTVVIMLWVFSTEDRTAVVVLANRTVCLHCLQWSIGTYHGRDELSSIMFMVGPQLQYIDVH